MYRPGVGLLLHHMCSMVGMLCMNEVDDVKMHECKHYERYGMEMSLGSSWDLLSIWDVKHIYAEVMTL